MLKCTYLTSRLCSSLLHTINQLFSFVQSIYCNCYSFLVVVQNVRRGFLLLDGIALTCDNQKKSHFLASKGSPFRNSRKRDLSYIIKMSTLNSTFFHVFIVLPFCTIRSLFYCIFSLLGSAIVRLPLLPTSHAPYFRSYASCFTSSSNSSPAE